MNLSSIVYQSETQELYNYAQYLKASLRSTKGEFKP